VARPAGRRSGMVAHAAPRRSAVEPATQLQPNTCQLWPTARLMQLARNGIADVRRPASKRTDGCHGFSRYSVSSHSALRAVSRVFSNTISSRNGISSRTFLPPKIVNRPRSFRRDRPQLHDVPLQTARREPVAAAQVATPGDAYLPFHHTANPAERRLSGSWMFCPAPQQRRIRNRPGLPATQVMPPLTVLLTSTNVRRRTDSRIVH
jgi:hypothetical protein